MVPHPDTPLRGAIILKDLRQGGFSDVVSPGECAIDPILAVHVGSTIDSSRSGKTGLKRWLRGDDQGRVAVAALFLLFEMKDSGSADVLVKLAPSRDIRFQISAGYALCRDRICRNDF